MADHASQPRRSGAATDETLPGDPADRPSDLLERCFDAGAPNRRWVADITYVQTFSGWVYTAFVMDLFARTILKAGRSLITCVLILRSMRWRWRYGHGGADLGGLVHHSDRGVQYTSIRYAGAARRGKGSPVGGEQGRLRYDNAAAEALETADTGASSATEERSQRRSR